MGRYGIPCIKVCIIDTFFCIFFITKNAVCNRITETTVFFLRFLDRLFISLPVHIDYLTVIHSDTSVQIAFYLYTRNFFKLIA